MKTPLRYQATCADCGKTSAINAFMYLFEREEIAPQVVDFITRVTGDCNLCINGSMRGTSANALSFIADWCNDYLVKAGYPIRCRSLRGDEVSMADGSPLVEGLRTGAVAVCGCSINVDHYVLLTGLEGDSVRMFDPYYDEWPLCGETEPQRGVVMVGDAPFSHNRLVARAALEAPAGSVYSLEATCGRDAVLFWRTSDEPLSPS